MKCPVEPKLKKRLPSKHFMPYRGVAPPNMSHRVKRVEREPCAWPTTFLQASMRQATSLATRRGDRNEPSVAAKATAATRQNRERSD